MVCVCVCVCVCGTCVASRTRVIMSILAVAFREEENRANKITSYDYQMWTIHRVIGSLCRFKIGRLRPSPRLVRGDENFKNLCRADLLIN